jgi:putative tryptophan/tyrosine transport system substrate-binding protein
MRRREFITLLGGAAVARSHAALTRDSPNRPLVALLLVSWPMQSQSYVSGLQRGLQELGLIDGQNVHLLYRYAEGDETRLPALAEELVSLKPDIIVAATPPPP